MMDPIGVLVEQHDAGLKQLAVLGESAEGIRKNGFSKEALERIAQATHFINTEVRSHNRNEEEALFPVLERVISPMGPTRVMREEHRQLWDGLERLEGLVEKAKESPEDDEVLGGLTDAADFVVDLLTAHIDKENNVLYPMAQRMLTSEQMGEVARLMEQFAKAGG
ncbi:MAG: hemerythrin domain-containing protein [bacterium]